VSAAPLAYVVSFERIGRHHDLTLECEAVDADDLAEQVFRFAGRHLGSRDYVVSVDLDADATTGKGSIDGGRFGRFTVASR
jgi:hypothetical protein